MNYLTKIIIALFIIFSSISTFCQYTIFDNNGMVDIKPTDNAFIVIETEGSSIELYNKVKMYVNQVMNNPEASIIADEKGVFIKWRTYVPEIATFNAGINYEVNIKYNTSISCKDNKIKVVVNIFDGEVDNGTRSWPLTYTRGGVSYYGIYKKNGIITNVGQNIKTNIETYFNDMLKSIELSLSNEPKKDDW